MPSDPAPSHAAHSHSPSRDADRRLLTAALLLIVAFMAAEVIAGVAAHSLALIADAGHMLTDAAAIGLALAAMRLAARPAWGSFTFGLRRAEILSAQANGLTLLILSVLFVVEGVRRLVDPPNVDGGLVLAVALGGIAVNLVAGWLLSKANRQSMNVEGAFKHIVTDLYAFIGTAVAAAVILTTGWDRADAIATLLVAALMLKAGVGLVRESGRVFLEASPRGLFPQDVRASLLAVEGVLDVHELHVWEVTSGFPALSAHVLVDSASDCHARRLQMEALLAQQYGVDHTTLQVDHGDEHISGPAPSAPASSHAGHPGGAATSEEHRHEDGCG